MRRKPALLFPPFCLEATTIQNSQSTSDKTYRWYERWTNFASIVILLATIIALWYALKLKHGNEDVQRWLPETAPSRVAYAEFTRKFIGNQVLVVAWRGANLDDPRIARATDQLNSLKDRNPDWPIAAITNSRQAIDALRGKMQGLTTQAAIDRLAGQTVGKDGSSFIAVVLSDCSPSQRDAIITGVSQTVEGVGINREDIVFAGEPYQSYLIDVHSRLAHERYMPISIVLSILAAWWCLRSWKFTIMVMILAGMGQIFGMALISALVGQMGAILIVVPTLLFMLTLSGATHLVHYYEHACTTGHRYPGLRAVELGVIPCAFASLTTALAFVSLAFSDLQPVVQFGWIAAGGMVVTTAVLLVTFAPATRIAGVKLSEHQQSENENRLVEWMLALVHRYCNWIVVLSVLLLGIFSWSLIRLESTTRFDGMFNESHPSVQSLRWVEQRVGPIETLEFLVSFPTQPQEIDIIQQLDAVQQLQTQIDRHEMIHSTFSAVNLMPPMPTQTGSRATVRRSIFRRVITSDMGLLAAAQLVHSTPEEVSWRITARFKTETDSQFHQLRLELENRAHDRLKAIFADDPSSPRLEVTGLRSVIETANRTMLRDLVVSFATSFFFITPFMMIAARSFWGGILLMLPNVLPVVFVFGTMSFLNIRVDIASILTASVALGIAVDDTLHITAWYLRSRRAGRSAEESVALAIRQCFKPMIFTSVICTSAMMPFLFCEFLPTCRFAFLLVLILLFALLGDLILAPSILCSPIGRWIGARKLDHAVKLANDESLNFESATK